MGSASGKKTMVINPRERAVSSDINRMQQFDGFDLATAFAYLFDSTGSDVASSGGATIISSSASSPMPAEIFAGLTVKPQIGSTQTQVDPGIMICCSPDAVPNPDDSPYKLVNDPGIQDGTQLPLVPNASGSTQIHIVECQRVDTVLETDNRDVFDPGTGLFAPALVNKVIVSRLQYRIRVVTLAGGVTTAAGWLPLAVALVPNGAATWDACPYIWDVRPLVADRAQTPLGNLSTTVSSILHSDVDFEPFSLHLRGRIEAIGPSGRKLGGDLAYGPADLFLDLASSELQPSGYATPANTPYYLYLCEAFGLPRWCRYTPVSAGFRLPGRLRGIPVLAPAAQSPAPVRNQNLVGLSSPTAFGFPGFIGAIGHAVAVWAGMADSGGVPLQRGFSDGLRGFYQEADGIIAATSSTTTTATFNVPLAINTPANARELKFRLQLSYAGASATAAQIRHALEFDDGAASTTFDVAYEEIGVSLTSSSYTVQFDCWVPVPHNYPIATAQILKILVTHGGASAGYVVPPDFAHLQLLGWRL